MTRQLGLLCLGVLAAALAACASNSASQCEATGILCPSGMHCAAAQPICISDTIRCGDAHKDADEECDDGNNIDGDGCSHGCTIEVCGNHRIDPREQCDDGNTADGDGCSHGCTLEVCGNGIKDFGEACDDGNTKDGDGCSANCKSTEICGNGIRDDAVGEVCDDGNTVGGDHCSADCRSGEGCGNGIVDPGEECDDGNITNSDDCRIDCVVNRCGDGVLDTDGSHKEACESATVQSGGSKLLTSTESATCNNDCSLPSCGDGKVNHSFTPPGAAGPEQCDVVNGAGSSLDADNADCTAHCQVNVCGDGLHNTQGPSHAEACDDGNKLDFDGCSNVCTFPSCGNGIVDQGEECDDHNTDNNDDCRNDCVVNRCGDGVRNINGTHTEACESATVQPANSRALTSTESQTCNNDCSLPSCGDGKVNHSFTPSGAAGPEQCDAVNGSGGSLNADNRDCTAHCQINTCGDGLPNLVGPIHVEACDDGNDLDFDGCSNACTLPNCGNGIVDQGEECDDGNSDSNDDCRNDCVVNRCGDGVQDLRGTHTEACESATIQPARSRAVTSPESQTCNNDCSVPSCGDGKVNHSFTPPGAAGPEQCDAVNGSGGSLNADNRDCTAHCQINTCGDTLHNSLGPNHLEGCDDGNRIDADGCSNACTLPNCGNGIVDQGEECDDGNSDSNDDCRNDCVVNRCGDGVRNIHGTHTEACESATVQLPSSRALTSTESQTCNNDCSLPRCGDGKVNKSFTPAGATGPEQCDMVNGAGTSINADSADCTAHCQVNVCGDGLFNTAGPNHVEPCDDGNRIDADGCSNACTLPHCGNGIVDQGEQCDDGNSTPGDTCENDCTRPRCGNGIKDVGEDCDDGNASNQDNCSNACRFATCGDGFLRTLATAPPPSTPTVVEQCDGVLGTVACTWAQASKACSTCSGSCVLQPQTAPFCGDGNTDSPFETCDSRNATCGACSSDCQTAKSHAAGGLIFAAAGKDLKPTDTFTVSDGFHLPTLFAFSTTPVTGAVTIPFTNLDTNIDMAIAIRDKINSAAGLDISALRQGSVVVLTNDHLSSKGNGTTADPRIVEVVETTNFAVIDMAGGEGGDCDLGAACATDADCASNSCSTTVPHVCQ